MSSPSKFLWNLNLLNLFDLFLIKERTPKSEIAYMILINQSNFIYKALKNNTEVDQSAVQRNKNSYKT